MIASPELATRCPDAAARCPDAAAPEPFSLDRESDYRAWRAVKLARLHAGDHVTVSRLGGLAQIERGEILARCAAANLALYRCTEPAGPAELLAFGRQLGLVHLDGNPLARLDGVATISNGAAGLDREFIPYTTRALNWHTDGYYNETGHQVRAVIMHCVSQAVRGGATALLDPELVYIRVRDCNPAYIRALMAPDALTIPAFVADGRELRPPRTGPVFSVHPGSGALHMRYTIRKRHVQWKDDAITAEARQCLIDLLDGAEDDVIRVRLQPGEGVVCNNVLHGREAYEDAAAAAAPRTVLRARYQDRLAAP